MNIYKNRIEKLRRFMDVYQFDAVIITGTDPHSGEYPVERWKTRAYISGFTGSYGQIVVTTDKAGLWTDTRYFVQAKAQLKGTGISMHKLRVPGAVLPEEWLAKKLKKGSRVGVDYQTITLGYYRIMDNTLKKSGITLESAPDFFDFFWENRPELPLREVFVHDVSFSGRTISEKINVLNLDLAKYKADFQVITALDEIAWLFNLRGSDVIYNPVFTGFAVSGKSGSVLFTDKRKITAPVKGLLHENKVKLKGYDDFWDFLKKSRGKTFYMDPSSVNFAVYEAIAGNNTVVEGVSAIATLKSVKNKVEIEGFKSAMRKDGAALVEFLFWISETIDKEQLTEYKIARKLDDFRSSREGYMGESFSPIVGYRSHGAIVHLSVDAENALKIEPEGILLFDSGGQYRDGTTDITRTIALGKVSEQQKNDFTLVLKGMISLAMARFPMGTLGCHIDILARKALWDNGLNYGHGTGHGVGHFLCVHEGPMSVRQELNNIPILPGNVLSNEPALYREGEYGLRTENLMVCVVKEKTGFGTFLGFETLSLCPIDTQLIRKDLLSDEELYWINNYHSVVYNELAPLLNDQLKSFLKNLTQEI